MVNKILEIKNLTKTYKDRIAVNHISFDIYEGEIFGFIGPNGAGKSTAIKMITGLAKITEGDVYINSQSIKKNFKKAISNVGAIVESPEMYNYMTGYENLLYFARLHKNVTKERIFEVAKLVNLESRLKDKVKKYSMGMKQRLGIAQAILHKPKLLILDEPTNGLDAYGIIEVRNLLKELARKEKISILISSHILAELEMICDTIAVIKDGKIIELKSLEKLKQGNNADVQNIALKVDYPNYAGKLIYQRYNVSVELAGSEIIFPCPEKSVPDVIAFLISKRLSIFNMRTITKSLEQVFMDIINNKK